jgi:ABC-type polar amino acid transport system ATPase subunit
MYILTDVSKSYGNNLVLKSMSCELTLNGLIAIMGPSGSGKSTLLRLLSFLEAPDAGGLQLQLGNQRFTTGDRPWPIVTCVFQKQFLWPHLTLRDNIILPLRTLGARDIEERLATVTHLFDMSSFVGRFPNEVSAGQAQRGALARAFVLNPQVILFDEAHFGLDLEQQKTLNDHMIKLQEAGVALLVVTHSLDFARHYAANIVVVEDGRITELGSRRVLKNPKSTYLRRAIGIAGV